MVRTRSRSAALAALIFAGAATGLPAAAGAEEPWARPGPYLGVSGVHGSNDFDDRPFRVDDSLGASGRAGYRWNRWVATEFQGEWLADFEHPFGRTIETATWMVNARGYPLETPAAPFFLVGLGAMAAFTEGGGRGSSSSGGFAARFGGGLDLYLSENLVLALTATYVLPTGAIDDLDYTSFQWGLTWRFGSSEEE